MSVSKTIDRSGFCNVPSQAQIWDYILYYIYDPTERPVLSELQWCSNVRSTDGLTFSMAQNNGHSTAVYSLYRITMI